MYVKTENRTMLLKGSIHTQQENQGPKVTYLRVALRNSSQLCMLMFPLEENSIYPNTHYIFYLFIFNKGISENRKF